MALIFALIGLGLAVAFFTILLNDWGCTKLLGKIFLIVTVLFGILVFSIPFFNNTKSLDKHVVIRTDTYNDIQYDEVMKVEYDLYKADHWWTWWYVTNIEAENIKVSAE